MRLGPAICALAAVSAACMFAAGQRPGTARRMVGQVGLAPAQQGRKNFVLAGVDAGSATLFDVLEAFGNPSSVKGDVEMRFCWRTGVEYICTLFATASFRASDGTPTTTLVLSEIEAWGSASVGSVGETGAGLALGDSCGEAEKIYGRPYWKSARTLYYRLGKVDLHIGCDGARRVSHLGLEIFRH